MIAQNKQVERPQCGFKTAGDDVGVLKANRKNVYSEKSMHIRLRLILQNQLEEKIL